MHQANGSGLQEHSIGAEYPWAVVGTIDAFGDTKYYAANLETNQRMVAEFYHSSLAHKWARELKDNPRATALVQWR